jgi:curved DNA-binding protein CbpA
MTTQILLREMTQEYDYLHLFGVSLPLDEKSLQLAYRQLAKQVHPDRFAGTPEQPLAEAALRHLNRALDTLKDEQLCGRYLAARTDLMAQYAQPTTGIMLPVDPLGEDGQAQLRQIQNAKRAQEMAQKAEKLDKQGKIDEAMREYQEAIRLDAASAVYHSSLALLMRKKGWEAYAQAEFRKALGLNPSDQTALQNFHPLGSDSPSPGGMISRLKTLFKSPESKQRLGDILVDKGFIDDKKLQQALKHHKSEKQPLGQVLLKLNYIRPEQLGEALIAQSQATS